jgi:hypothetical protein
VIEPLIDNGSSSGEKVGGRQSGVIERSALVGVGRRGALVDGFQATELYEILETFMNSEFGQASTRNPNSCSDG